MAKLQLIATTVFGIEAIAGRELWKLGYTDQHIENGRVTFTGDESALCRANLWLRTAERILLKIGEFNALSFEELFVQTKALPWDEIIPGDAKFPVEGKSIDSKLFSVSDCQAIVKKAIVEKMKLKYKCDWFEETGPTYKVGISLLKDLATLTIDTSGPGLNKRGYRTLVGEAPLKETIASALVQVSRWNKDRSLIDPFCGIGTIPIEAAMIGLNIAPGLKRKFAAEEWPDIPQNLWANARDEAESLIDLNQELKIQGSDINDEVMNLARYHAGQAGVANHIHLQRMPVADIRSRQKYGFIITNPPYGERSGEISQVEELYRQMGAIFKAFDTWSFYILTSHRDFEKLFGRRADKKRKLYNGRIQCDYYQFYGPPPERKKDF
jgi:putative N6-adenine-specific DNA methylase